MILFEDEDEAAARAGALEQKILEMIEEAALALGIEPTGWAWKCSECGKSVRPDSNFGHDGGPDLRCGPVGIAPEHAEDAWRAVLAAIRGRQGSAEPFGFFVVDRDGRADHEALDSPFCATRADAEHFRDLLNGFPPSDGPLGSRQPFRVAPVGPVVDLKPFGWGAVDETGLAMNQLVYRSREALDGRVPDGFEVVPLFYVPPPDRPAEAVEAKAPRTCDACGAPIQGGNCCAKCHAGIEANRERRLAEAPEPDPRAERWAAIPKAGKL